MKRQTNYNFLGTKLDGVEMYHYDIYEDDRGSFSAIWNSVSLQETGMRNSFIQLNSAVSKFGVLRGMHRQNQTKLVTPIVGEIFDVALNPCSGEWIGVNLKFGEALFIPPQYAHGYLVLTETSIVQYAIDAPYDKVNEEVFKWNAYNISWPLATTPRLSEKDS